MKVKTDTTDYCPECFARIPQKHIDMKACDGIARIFRDRHKTLAVCQMGEKIISQQDRSLRQKELQAIADDLSIYFKLLCPDFSRLDFRCKCQPN